MAYLIESNLLVRLANGTDAEYQTARNAVYRLHSRGERLHTAPQNLVEFRSVATRPTSANGLGLTSALVEAQATTYEALFPILAETPDIYPAWKALVQAAGILGKQVHDAQLAAVCHVHGISHILTFNVRHFARFAAHGPGLVIVSPHDV